MKGSPLVSIVNSQKERSGNKDKHRNKIKIQNVDVNASINLYINILVSLYLVYPKRAFMYEKLNENFLNCHTVLVKRYTYVFTYTK